MNWLKEVMTKCLPLKIQLLKTNGSEEVTSDHCIRFHGKADNQDASAKRLFFICAYTPDQAMMKDLLDLVPNNLECLFIETVKSITTMELAFLIQQSGGVMTLFEPKGHHLAIEIKGSQLPPTDDPVWADVQEILEKDGYASSWEIKINDETIVYNAKMAQEVKSHKIRDRGFTDTDLTDLKIVLETTCDVNDFLAAIEKGKL